MALVGAACSGGGSTATGSSGLSQGTAPSARKDDQAKTQSVSITLADLPSGWVQTHTGSPLAPQDNTAVGDDPCFGTPIADTHKTGETSGTEFKDSASGSLVFVTTTSYDDQKWTTQDVNDLLGPRGTKCMQSVGQQLASLSHETDYVTKVEPPRAGLPSSVKVVTRTQYTDNSQARPTLVRQDSFTLTAGRFEVRVNFRGSGAMKQGVENAILMALDNRLSR